MQLGMSRLQSFCTRIPLKCRYTGSLYEASCLLNLLVGAGNKINHNNPTKFINDICQLIVNHLDVFAIIKLLIISMNHVLYSFKDNTESSTVFRKTSKS
jgi:hypothetical protein